MGNSCLYIDTNVGIDRIFKEENLQNHIEDIENIEEEYELYTSKYVVGEFMRTVFLDCCALHSIVLEEDSLNGVYRRINKMMESNEGEKERVAKRYDLILKSLNYPGTPDREKTLTNLSNYIRFYLKPSFTHGLKLIESQTECELFSCNPKKHDGHFRIEIPCSETSDDTSCILSEFINATMDDLEKIQDGLQDEKESYYLQLKRLISELSNDDIMDISIEECKTLGDVIVIKDCPSFCILVSRDHHIKDLCEITGQNYHILG